MLTRRAQGGERLLLLLLDGDENPLVLGAGALVLLIPPPPLDVVVTRQSLQPSLLEYVRADLELLLARPQEGREVVERQLAVEVEVLGPRSPTNWCVSFLSLFACVRGRARASVVAKVLQLTLGISWRRRDGRGTKSMSDGDSGLSGSHARY